MKCEVGGRREGKEERLKTRGCRLPQCSAQHGNHRASSNFWPPYLYCHHRKDLHGDSIEFIKTAPGTGLSKALIDVAARLQ